MWGWAPTRSRRAKMTETPKVRVKEEEDKRHLKELEEQYERESLARRARQMPKLREKHFRAIWRYTSAFSYYSDLRSRVLHPKPLIWRLDHIDKTLVDVDDALTQLYEYQQTEDSKRMLYHGTAFDEQTAIKLRDLGEGDLIPEEILGKFYTSTTERLIIAHRFVEDDYYKVLEDVGTSVPFFISVRGNKYSVDLEQYLNDYSVEIGEEFTFNS